MPRLSVCLIVRNEERQLPRCLASIRALADDLVIVDTGSTDRTVAIAREHDARVFHYVWEDDFSAARNFCIAQATGEWILSLDADETIAARDIAAIRQAIGRTDIDAELVPQRHYLTAETTLVGSEPGPGDYDEGAPYAAFLDVDCRRLFRNQPWLRFRNAVHEEVVSIDAAHPLRERRGTWVIHHFGKAEGPDLLRAKGQAYLRIGMKKVAADPSDAHAHFELGVQHAELDQHDEAVRCFERALALEPGIRDAQLRLALCEFQRKAYRRALAALAVSARTLPGRAADVALAEGNVHRELGDRAAAERAFRRALTINPRFAAASINLALLHSGGGDHAAALRVLDAAVQRTPSHTELRALRGAVRLDSGDDAGALADLERAGADRRALWLRGRILVRQRRFAEARDCLATPAAASDPDLIALRGSAALGLGELDDAVRLLDEAVRLRPTAEAAVNLSTALEARGDRVLAMDAAVTASRLAPADLAILTRTAGLAGLPAPATGRSSLTVFFYQPYSIEYDGDTPRSRGLGGTESAVVYLAEALARRGHRCVVLNNCPRPVVIDGVEYARWETLAGRCVADRPDVLVGVRFWEALGRVRLAPLQILWTGDAFDQPFVSGLGDAEARAAIDLFMLQSGWQVETFHAQHRLPLSRVRRTTLGTASSAIAIPMASASAPRAKRLAYASTPFRGLDLLLDLFPRIRRACPDAELEIFSSMQVYGVAAEEDRRQFDAVYRKADQPGVTLVGTVSQPELAARLRDARVLAYPNYYAETFCIAAAEAQAAGCVIVTSQLGALPETVGEAGICIAGDPRSRAYGDAFVDACVSLLEDDDRWLAMSAQARAQASSRYAWPAIAEEWEITCRAALTVEAPEIARAAAHLQAGRVELAQRMVARATRPDAVPSAAWDALLAFVASGDGGSFDVDARRLVALYFPSFRRSGLLDG